MDNSLNLIYSLSKLPIFVAGFMIACHFYDETKSGMDRFTQFQNWFEKRHSIERSSSWTLPFQEMVNHDDQAALDFFFSELEKFANESSR